MDNKQIVIIHKLILEKIKDKKLIQYNNQIKRKEFIEVFKCFGISSIYYSNLIKEMEAANLIKVINKRSIQLVEGQNP